MDCFYAPRKIDFLIIPETKWKEPVYLVKEVTEQETDLLVNINYIEKARRKTVGDVHNDINIFFYEPLWRHNHQGRYTPGPYQQKPAHNDLVWYKSEWGIQHNSLVELNMRCQSTSRRNAVGHFQLKFLNILMCALIRNILWCVEMVNN